VKNGLKLPEEDGNRTRLNHLDVRNLFVVFVSLIGTTDVFIFGTKSMFFAFFKA
jgi:hypothetical protein